MHFYCTTDFEEIHCSCGFRGFGQGHRHQKSSYPNGYELFCAVGQELIKKEPRRALLLVVSKKLRFSEKG